MRFLLAIALVCTAVGPAGAGAAPIKVACIGEQTTHSHAFPAMNREAQPVGMQEYPAILQGLLGVAYQVRNFGDCCATVTQGYSTVGQETHPYVQGSNPNEGAGYNESIAFLPDVVVIGSWGRHDWGKAKASTETWNLSKFQQDYDDLVQRYMNLSTHPRIFVSLPVPILFGTDGPDNGVLTSSVVNVIKVVAAKYGLPIVDLYASFFNHMELFKQPPDSEGEGEHVTNAGLRIIADKVYAAMIADATDAGTDAGPSDASSDSKDAASGNDASRDSGAAGAGMGGSAGGGGATGNGGQAGTGGTSGSTGSGGSATTGTGGVAGSSIGSGTAGAAGSTTTAGRGGSSANAGTSSSSSGCSCRMAAQITSSWAGLSVIAGLALLRRRYRRR